MNPPKISRRALVTSGLGAGLGASVARALGAPRAHALGAKPPTHEPARPAPAPPTAGPANAASPNPRPARACVLLYMAGGPSHIDTFDPKPGRATGGPFRAIPTAVEGLQLSEHLPRLAARVHRLAVVRSLVSKEGNHDRARHLMHTGYAPQGGVVHPGFGALVSETRGGGLAGLPGHVAIGGAGASAGFLPARHGPFPVKNPAKPVRYLTTAKGLGDARFDRRLGLLRGLDERFGASRGGDYVPSRRDIYDQAVGLMRSPSAGAFDLSGETASAKDAYGGAEFGLGCLMARRLVEAGVPFVEVTLDGWDTHEDNFDRVRALSATLDRAMSALLDDLAARGLLDQTLVLWMGDFGRTPRINDRGGRDHHPACSSVLLAGGGVRGGQLIGATDADGAAVVDRPVSVPDLYASVAFALGIEANRMRMAPSGRPIKTVDGGRVVDGLL